ncbi:unnamed protein product [Arabidopsis halleri]
MTQSRSGVSSWLALTAHQSTLSPLPPSFVYGWKNPTARFLLFLALITESDKLGDMAKMIVRRVQRRMKQIAK